MNSRVQAVAIVGWVATAKSRRTAVAIAAGQLPLCACRPRQTAHSMSRQFQMNSRGDQDREATASAV